ncbi:MAG: YtxH domain-containing protein [Streptococcaceae bacterium]|jgi:gas vesicle protein|nr:YtxH domain-containing protein [Streptococcaceae bacterium]
MAKKSHFLLGAAVGAVAALFLAPKKGSEFQEDAKKAYSDFKENPQEFAKARLADAKDFSVEKFNDVKGKFDSGEYSADKARDYLLEKRDQIRERVESGDLSADNVKDFFNKTKDSLVSRFQTTSDKEASEQASDLDENYSWTDSEDKKDDW